MSNKQKGKNEKSDLFAEQSSNIKNQKNSSKQRNKSEK
jgi:hypothetical protein